VPLQTGQIAPDFEQDTTNGSLRFHEWAGRSWCVLLSQAWEFTHATVAELAEIARLKPQWTKSGVKVIGLSPNSSDVLASQEQEIEHSAGIALNFPRIADADRMVSTLYGLTQVGTESLRSLFVIDPDKTIRMVRTYAPAVNCKFAEILRSVGDLQLSGDRTDNASLSGAWAGQEDSRKAVASGT
jgi:alkyl hydroperoxide reductase subunit AhpC